MRLRESEQQVIKQSIYDHLLKFFQEDHMEVHISRNMEKVLSEASKKSGFNEEEFVERAVLFYADTIQKQLSLKKEFEQWDELSDDALVNFEAGCPSLKS